MAVAHLETLGQRLRETIGERLHALPLPPSIWRVLTFQKLTGWPPEKSTRDTAWLDGLRGVAAFLVMIGHFGPTFWSPMTYEAPFGANNKGTQGGEDNPRVPMNDIFRLPLLRVWFSSGHAQVSIFFVLSGFVLSWSPLRSMRQGQGQNSTLGQSLSSAVFRRWIRLYLPCFAIAFWQLWEYRAGWRVMAGVPNEEYVFMQIWDFIKRSARFANPFWINRAENQYVHAYDWTMWTIPHEFAGSLMVFLTVLAISRIKKAWKRTVVLSMLATVAFMAAQWDFWLFATGVLFANYVVAQGGFEKLDPSRLQQSMWIATLLIGLLLAGVPPRLDVYYDRPDYEWLDMFTPEDWQDIEGGGRLWWCLGGILCVISFAHLPLARKFFELPLMRYMGRISYMLYLVHRIVLNLVGGRLTTAVYKTFGRSGYIDISKAADGSFKAGGNFGFRCITYFIYLILLVVIVPLVFLASHWAERLIDAPSTRLARSIDTWFVKGGADQTESEKTMEELETLPTHSVTLPTHASDHTRSHTDTPSSSSRAADEADDHTRNYVDTPPSSTRAADEADSHSRSYTDASPSSSRAADEADDEDAPLLAEDPFHDVHSERQQV
nr:hypothetical protein B0A51_04964 [Rachicladosporium sp. CCFEE 5018]